MQTKVDRIVPYEKTDKEIKHEMQVKQARANFHSHPGSKPAKVLKTAYKYKGDRHSIHSQINGLLR